MKRVDKYFVFILLFLIFILKISIGTAEGQVRRYSIESGSIEYVISGHEKGRETVFFDHWGLREARYSQIERSKFGINNTLILKDKEMVYKIDEEKGLGNKSQDSLVKEYLEQDFSSPVELGPVMMENLKGKK